MKKTAQKKTSGIKKKVLAHLAEDKKEFKKQLKDDAKLKKQLKK